MRRVENPKRYILGRLETISGILQLEKFITCNILFYLSQGMNTATHTSLAPKKHLHI